jgi:tetrahydromethanopterin S-methyltransferase subunit A
MLKIPAEIGYPPEPGRYLRGNDLSPVAVAVILLYNQEEIPPEIEDLVRIGVETGAALSGTIQTENIGIEKLVCNVVANPNIRYLIVFGPESPGHFTGQCLVQLVARGLDERQRILDTEAPTPYLFNLPSEYLDRFRKQIQVVDLLNEGDPDLLRRAVWSCYQEKPTKFRDYELFDPGAYPAEPLVGKLTWRVTKPELEPKDETEGRQREELKALIERYRQVAQRKRVRPTAPPGKDSGEAQ